MVEASGMRRAAARLAAAAALWVLGLAPAARAAAHDDGETYESPQYGYTLTYDTGDWEVVREDEDEDDAYDTIALSNGRSTIALIGDPDYEDGELADCVDDYLAGLEQNDGASDIDPYDERDAEGEDGDVAWTTYTYTFEFADGDEEAFVRYFRCTALDDGLTLVVIQDAGVDDYEAEAAEREDLLKGFEAPSASDEEPEGDGGRAKPRVGDDDGGERARQDGNAGETAEVVEGEWEGETEDGEPFTLTVLDGGVSSVSYAYECNGDLILASSSVSDPAPIEDGAFAFETETSSQTTAVAGTIADGEAEGTLIRETEDKDECGVELDWTAEEP